MTTFDPTSTRWDPPHFLPSFPSCHVVHAALQSLFGNLVGGPQARVNIKLTGIDQRMKKEMSSGRGTTHLLPLYQAHEGVGGIVEVILAPGKKLEHLGIKIELVGAIEVRGQKSFGKRWMCTEGEKRRFTQALWGGRHPLAGSALTRLLPLHSLVSLRCCRTVALSMSSPTWSRS